MTSAAFDPEGYKETTREQWQRAAEPWFRWGAVLERWLEEASELMLDLAEVGPGDRVLDVAAGAGGQSLRAARRVGPSGSVLATDISPEILRYAERAAREAGLTNLETREADAEALDAEPASFDAAISRLGLIYLPDRAAALGAIRRALKPDGRIASVNYTTPERNEFFSIPVGIIRERAGLPAPAPGQPGPFSLGAEGAIEAAYEGAGFTEVAVRRLAAPLRLDSAAEFISFARESFGALHQMLAGLEQSEQAEVWAEIEAAMRRFEGPEGFAGPCELVVAAARR
ncbi:MAG TPA: methyltransferase domain-containing protein [Solirubrobacterales bacterium]|nr:methyltransferase domain-containing protein [Solirubrobacterales bacterium]